MKIKVYERWGGVALLAGVLCYFFAFLLIVMAPAWVTDAEEPYVTEHRSGERVRVPEYTAAEAAGREVYAQQVCWHCHSQFIRPVNDENLRWGPVSQAGESMVDRPHLFGTRRIGPDLAREGLRRVDDWHVAHFYDPRYTVPQSVMPGFTWLFAPYHKEQAIQALLDRLDTDGDGIISPKFDRADLWSDDEKAALRSADLDNGGVLAPETKQGESQAELAAYVDGYTGVERSDGLVSDYDARPRGTKDLENLTAYMQRLGTAIGPWRTPISTDTPFRTNAPAMVGVDDFEFGSFRVFDDAGKPVLDADGRPTKEPGVTFVPDGVMPLRAREARAYGVAAEALDEAGREDQRFVTEEYVARMAAWRKANPQWDQRLQRGEQLYQRYCVGCHGEQGRGNGPAAKFLQVRPRDFTLAKYRYRSTQAGNLPLDGDLYRSLWQGLPGSSMPSWRELPEEHLWLLVDYVKHFQETQGGEAKPFNDESLRLAIPPMPPMAYERMDDLFLRGKAVYVAMKCNNCHGTTGRADGPGWNGTGKDNGGLVRPRDFAKRSEDDQPELRLRGGATPRDIYRTVFTGLDGTGMPSSQVDFEGGWRNAEALQRLVDEGAPADQIEAARKTARVKLFSVLGEGLPGVVSETTDGTTTEYLESLRRTTIFGTRGTFGDDWALVWYVYRLVYGEDAEWPVMFSEDD